MQFEKKIWIYYRKEVDLNIQKQIIFNYLNKQSYVILKETTEVNKIDIDYMDDMKKEMIKMKCMGVDTFITLFDERDDIYLETLTHRYGIEMIKLKD